MSEILAGFSEGGRADAWDGNEGHEDPITDEE
jgi:hypothetical protein